MGIGHWALGDRTSQKIDTTFKNSNFLRDWLKYIKLPSRRATKRKKGNWDTGNEERAIAPLPFHNRL
ncbi:MAG: hypothetical protein ACYTXI_39715 [Nostoc sp.]